MVINHNKLQELRLINKQKVIGLAAGTFDLLHAGHLQYINWSKSQCDMLVVYIRSDMRVLHVKGSQPFNPEQDRALLVDNLRAVDAVVIGSASALTVKPSIEIAMLLKPDVVLMGADWAAEAPVWRQSLPELDIKISPHPHSRSSTLILSGSGHIATPKKPYSK